MALISASILPQLCVESRCSPLNWQKCSLSKRNLHKAVKSVSKHGSEASIDLQPPSVVEFSDRIAPTRMSFSRKATVTGVNFEPPSGVEFSRRVASVTFLALLAGSIFYVDSAEARRIKPETIEKIRKKLEKMKKAGDPRNEPNKEINPPPSLTLKDLAGPLVEITI